MLKRYIGDSVYAQIDPIGRLVLTTEDGERVSNRIVMEPEVWTAAQAFVDHARARLEAAKTPEDVRALLAPEDSKGCFTG